MEMSEFIKALESFIKRRTKSSHGWLRARCESVSPLIFSIIDGKAQAGEGKSVRLVFMRGMDTGWKSGDEAAAILEGADLLILGRF